MLRKFGAIRYLHRMDEVNAQGVSVFSRQGIIPITTTQSYMWLKLMVNGGFKHSLGKGPHLDAEGVADWISTMDMQG